MINNKKSTLALTQIFLLIIGIISFGYVIGGQIGVVSAIHCEDIRGNYIGEYNSNACPGDSFETDAPSGGSNSKGDDEKSNNVEKASSLLTFSWLKKKLFPGSVATQAAAEGGGTVTSASVIGTAALYATAMALVTSGVAQALGADAQTGQAIGGSIGTAYLTYRTVTALGKFLPFIAANPVIAPIVAVVAVLAVLNNFFKKEDIKSVTFECKPWKAPIGWEDCERCNDNPILGCSEYQCKSLGSQCELINKGTSEQRCVGTDRNNISPPILSPWEEPLPEGYEYIPDPDLVLPHQGVIINYAESDDGCIPGFRIFAFGVTLNTVGTCRIDNIRTSSYEDMDSLGMGGNSLYIQNHSQIIMFPGQENLEQEGEEVPLGGEYSFFVRCEGNNGVSNEAEFGFKFCVEDEEDISSPQIYGSDPTSGNPITWFNETEEHEEDVVLYVNEPAECKWDHTDRDYIDMENSMTCASSVFDLNAQLTYSCNSVLTGLVNNQDNDFYFRCKDQPLLEDDAKRNVMGDSYKLTLIGTRPLAISDVEPTDETIKGATGSVRVELSATTSAGYQEGKSICQYKNTNDNLYTQFEHTDSYTHSTSIWLEGGDYEYRIRCYDLGGNFASETINFQVETDTQSPMIVRAYHESSYLKIITNEEATCVYDTVSCDYSFDDGLSMNRIGNTEHYTNWNTNLNYHIKCKDEFGNIPNPDQCSMIASPLEL